MIVKCEQCQTRFRIPDEKVPERGLRVRCARCQHTFRVTREPAAAVSGPVLSNVAPEAAGVGTGDLLSALTSRPPEIAPAGPGAYASPGEVPGRDPFADFDLGLQDDPFAQPTRIGSVPESILSQANGKAAEAPPAIAAAPDRVDDLFAQVDGSLSPEESAPDASALSGHPERSLFDFPEPAPAPDSAPPFREDLSALGLPGSTPAEAGWGSSDSPEAEAGAPASQPLARIALSSVTLTPGGPIPPQLPPTGLVDPPPGDPSEAATLRTAALRARRRGHALLRWSGAAVLGLLFFGAGALYTEEGMSLRGLSVDRVLDAWVGADGLHVVDVTNGLYETRAGTSVFYVRGDVQNSGQPPTRVRVRAEVLDGDSVVQSAEAFVGGVPTPEELHALVGDDALASLQQKLEQRAVSLSSGGRAPFLVAFQQFPPDLSRYRLRLHLTHDAPRAIVSP